MCGIIGYTGKKSADSVLLVGLERLEYRGYDSAGIAVIDNGELIIRKSVGKLKQLNELLRENPVSGETGIGHTRWATHGEPSTKNAHPHYDCKGKIAVVHNGIIENYASLKEKLISEGHIFYSETDTEVIPHLIEKYYKGDMFKAVQMALKELKGSFAIAVISEYEPEKIYGARKGSPLIAGISENEGFLASDIPALVSLAREVFYLNDGELCIISKGKAEFYDFNGNPVEKRGEELKIEHEAIDKRGFPHFMLKEIYEQPEVVKKIIEKRIDENNHVVFENLGLPNDYLVKVTRIIIQAAGTSWHAGLVAKFWFEIFARVHTEVDISSEFRYRNPVIEGDTLMIAISQSGETADTLAGLREAKSKFIKVLSICNNINSSIARESDAVIDILAGPEIGVASTKAYIGELVSLFLFALYLAKVKWSIERKYKSHLLDELKKIPDKIKLILNQNEYIKSLADKYYNYNNIIFLGRQFNYPTAFEGALKLKEISYIHATAYQAGEFKHGPIALIDENIPVVCIATKGEIYEKMVSNIEEVKARGGKLIIIATEGDEKIKKYAEDVIYVPETVDILSPIINIIPLQLFAYYIALNRGCDVDKPRNLAKSVTVE